jgi:hypothetical protein
MLHVSPVIVIAEFMFLRKSKMKLFSFKMNSSQWARTTNLPVC